ncbi:hypothetical protein [Halosimplex marinum]|uniref:hypothetical protein n=1 Tax=Halosimplex marinum TaxID=3396620 RepID=UPI003F56B809
MVFERLRRREYVTAMMGGLAALGGCNDLGGDGAPTGTEPTAEGTDAAPTGGSTPSQTSEPDADEESGPTEGRALDEGRVLYAEPGEIQATIDEAADGAGGGVVRLQAGRTYDGDAPVRVKPGVTLDCNRAVVEITGDHDGLFLDTGSTVVDGRIDVTADNYSSSAVALDVTRSTHGKYNAGDGRDTAATFEGHVLGNVDDVGGNGIELVSDGAAFESVADAGITMGCRFAGTVAHFERGVRADVRNGGWINSVRFDLELTGNRVGFLHTGTGDGLLLSDLYGAVQTSWHEGAVGVRNATDQPSLTVYGRIWDADPDRSQHAVEGPGVTVVSDLAADHAATAADAEGSVGLDLRGGELRLVEYGSGSTLIVRPSDPGVVFETDGGTRLLLGEDGQVRPQPGRAYFQMLGEDLSERSGTNWWELAVDDGTNTDSGDPALGLWYAGEWLLFESTASVSP